MCAQDAYLKLRPWTDIERCECDSVVSLILVDLLTDNPIHCGDCRKEIDPERLQLSVKEIATSSDGLARPAPCTAYGLIPGNMNNMPNNVCLTNKGKSMFTGGKSHANCRRNGPRNYGSSLIPTMVNPHIVQSVITLWIGMSGGEQGAVSNVLFASRNQNGSHQV